jgi:alpha-glucoside transport system permease protein
MNQALMAVMTIVIGVGGCVGYFWLSNIVLDKLVFPARGPQAGLNITRANMVRPWLFLAPAVLALGLYLAYPVFATFWLSLNRNEAGELVFVGLDNYRAMFGEAKFWESMRNNMVWLIVVPAMSTAFGLLAAQLTDRISWGNIAKSLIFMPMAISFVGASVIWKLVYDTRDEGTTQIGLLNAIWLQFDGGLWSVLLLRILPTLLLLGLAAALAWVVLGQLRGLSRGGAWVRLFLGLGIVVGTGLAVVAALWAFGAATAELPYGKPQFWLQIPFWNNFFLMAVLIQIFFKVKVPQIMGTIVVVWTTITITVLKVFDIVRAMTGGQQETQVLANYMYDKLFVAVDWGVGSASAMVILLLVTPILVWNVWNARKEMR